MGEQEALNSCCLWFTYVALEPLLEALEKLLREGIHVGTTQVEDRS